MKNKAVTITMVIVATCVLLGAVGWVVVKQMSPKAVILNLKDDDAVRILSSVKPATLASILEKMPPADAAKYTGLITAEEGGSQ